MDIIFLELAGKPPASLVPDDYEIQEIIPPIVHCRAFHRQKVSGMALHDRVDGIDLRYEDMETKCFSFLFH
jgi:hypothetical protein